jgi:molybdenum cofactor guanylyltransferase
MRHTALKVPPSSVTAAILAGGRSRRFGSDKAAALVPETSVTFLERAVEIARTVSEHVLIIGSDRPYLQDGPARFVPDNWPGEGPGGGVVTALRATITQYLVVLSCDQPMLAAWDLRRLLEMLPGRPATAFGGADVPLHPLPCAFDVTRCRPLAEDAFAGGVRSMMALLQRCGAVLISFSDSGGASSRLQDVDTPQDLDRIIGQRFKES